MKISDSFMPTNYGFLYLADELKTPGYDRLQREARNTRRNQRKGAMRKLQKLQNHYAKLSKIQ